MHLMTLISVITYSTANNELPIIGILAQEAGPIKNYFPNDNYTSFISATYVKFVEAAGARAVPVWIGKDKNYYRSVVNNTNGLLLPGGGANLSGSGGYYDAGRMLYEIALEANQNGQYYPIFGICLGMELLAIVGANGKSVLTACSAQNIALPLEFKEGFRYSKLFHNADQATIEYMEKESVTYNNHQYCLTPKNFISSGLAESWQLVSTSDDKNGLEFISVFESKRYPFYGVQFHPERNIFGHRKGSNVPHSENAIKATQYFLNFFVFESRKSDHQFPTWQEEHASLIYNYQPIFLNIQNAMYEQLYMFK